MAAVCFAYSGHLIVVRLRGKKIHAQNAFSDFRSLCWETKKGLQEKSCKPLIYLASPTRLELVLAA